MLLIFQLKTDGIWYQAYRLGHTNVLCIWLISFLPVFRKFFDLISIHGNRKQGKDSIQGRVWDHKKQSLLWIDFYSLHFNVVQIKSFAFWHGKNLLFSFFIRNFIGGLSCIRICGYVVSVEFFFTTKSKHLDLHFDSFEALT